MVASYTQLLAQRYEGQLDDKAQTYIDYAVDGATRMQRLINDLLTYSRVSTQGPAARADRLALGPGRGSSESLGRHRGERGHRHQRRPAHGARRRDPAPAGVPEPHRQRHQVPRQGLSARPRVGPRGRRRVALLGAGQRHRHRRPARGQVVRDLPAPAHPAGVPGHGHRPGRVQTHRGAPRGQDLVRVRARQGFHLLLHAAQSERRRSP